MTSLWYIVNVKAADGKRYLVPPQDASLDAPEYRIGRGNARQEKMG